MGAVSDLGVVVGIVLLIFFIGVLLVGSSSIFCPMDIPWLGSVKSLMCVDTSRFCAAIFMFCGFIFLSLSLAYVGMRGNPNDI